MINKEKYLLDMEVQIGTKILSLQFIKKTLDFFEYGSKDRVYLLLLFSCGLRPGEPTELTWDNFIFEKRYLIFRPKKQHGKVLRRVKISYKIMQEILYYYNNNIFYKKKLFAITSHSFCRIFNKKRKNLPIGWQEYSEVTRQGTVALYHLYTLRGFRTTYATLVYYYYSKVYDHGDLAVKKTAKQMGHSSSFTTSEYYINRISELDIEKYQELPFLELLDYIIYNEIQLSIPMFGERQQKMIEFEC